jgi:hypothetical protein
VPDATLDDYSELVTKFHMGTHPLLPQPSWGQDAAYLAFCIDALVEERNRLRSGLGHAIDEMESMLPYVPEYFRDKWEYEQALEDAKKALRG